jgi:hypothetical protein
MEGENQSEHPHSVGIEAPRGDEALHLQTQAASLRDAEHVESHHAGVGFLPVL